MRPLTEAWVRDHLAPGHRIVRIQPLAGGITAEIRRLTVAAPSGSTHDLVLRSYVDPYYVARAADALTREATALSQLTGTGIPAPALIAADPSAGHCEFPSLLMTHLPGRPALADEGLATRIVRLARQLVAIHAVRPSARPPVFEVLTTPDTVVLPPGVSWSAAIDVIRRPRPRHPGRFLHRDFQPGNVLFSAAGEITGVVDWAGASWGPTDLDVAHCATNLALLHGPSWALDFYRAYEQAGGRLSPAPADRLYWQVRDALAASEELAAVSEPWRSGGRPDLTTEMVERRLNAYLGRLLEGG